MLQGAPTRAASDARDWANVLAEVPLFAGLSRRHLKKVAALARVRRFHDEMPIVRMGEPGDTMYVVLDGEVTVHRPGLTALSLGIGSYFGEVAILDGGARTATVIARGSVVCLTIAQSRLLKLLQAEPVIAVTLLRELAARLRTAQATS